MPSVGSVWLDVKPDMTGFGTALKTGAGVQADTTGKNIGQRMGANIGGQLKGLVGPAIASLSLAGGVALLKGSISEAREAEKIGRQTEAGIKSTGAAANVTAGQVGSLAEKLSNVAGIDDEVIQGGANLLLTFTNVRNEAGKGNQIFDQATEAALNLSAKGFGSMESASVMMGKALNDPIKGITALGRAGVQFTEEQKEQIKTLTETGDLLGAQKIILGEVNKQVGGAAAAAADPMDKLKVAFGNMQESLGLVILPLMEKIVPIFADLAKWIGENVDVIVPLVAVLGTFAAIVGTIIAITKVWTAVQTAFNIVMALNPIALVIIAIVALVAAIVLLWTKSETFRNIILGIWNAIKTAALAVFNGIKVAILAVWDAIQAATSAVWNAIKATITFVIDAIVWYFTTYFNVLKFIVTTAFNAVKVVISTVLDAVKATISGFVDSVLVVWRGLVKIVEVVAGVVGQVKDNIERAISWFLDAGKRIVHGLWDGISGAAGWLADKVKGLAAKITGPFAGVLGLRSPSRVFAGYGRDVVRGLVLGMDRAAPLAVGASTRLADALAAPSIAFGTGGIGQGSAGPGASSSSPVSIVQNINGALDPVVVGRVAADELAWGLKTAGR